MAMTSRSNNPRVWVLGAGSWGTALAHHLACLGYEVDLWCHEPEVSRNINEHHENHLYLSGVTLNRSLRAHSRDMSLLPAADLVLLVVPSQFFRSTLSQAARQLPEKALLVSCTKGLEAGTNYTMCEVAEDTLPKSFHRNLTCLSGPSFAREVAQAVPTVLTVASRNPKAAAAVQSIFSNDSLRLYTSPDVVGVELGGAVKNPLAIAAGMCAGLELGHNPLAALITRGLAEITRLAVARGGQMATLSGLSGLGDLVLTCTSRQSRNFSVGFRLAKGEKLPDILASSPAVAEGVENARNIVALAESLGVELPIVSAVNQVLHHDGSIAEHVQGLMTRSLKPELHSITRSIT